MAALWEELEVLMMFRDLEHPEVTCALRTGYPSWMQETEVLNDEDDEEDFDDDGYDQDAYEAYCDNLYEERRERELFGEW